MTTRGRGPVVRGAVHLFYCHELAYAVKVEFVKHDVDKAKIRILSPQQSSGENATGSVRGVDVMIDMPEKKSLSGTVKEGA